MPTLDPVTDAPQFTGPTRDWHDITSRETVYRQERFQITPKRLPVSLALKSRPKTVAPRAVDLQPQRVAVLVRSSNNRPAEAGTGPEGSMWAVSDPGNYDKRVLNGLAMGDEVAAVGVDKETALKLAALGALALGAVFLGVRALRG